jgi:hypothetical protein
VGIVEPPSLWDRDRRGVAAGDLRGSRRLQAGGLTAGARGPVLPDVRITADAVEDAARRFDCPYVPTPAGPIVYESRLGYSRLDGFYQSLRLALEIENETRDRK